MANVITEGFGPDAVKVEGDFMTVYVLTSLDEISGATYRVVSYEGDDLVILGDKDRAIDWAMDYADFGPDSEKDYFEDNMTDAEADADVLASAGWGTDEDYGCFGGDDY